MKITASNIAVGTLIDHQKEKEIAHPTTGTKSAHMPNCHSSSRNTPRTATDQRSFKNSESVQKSLV
jgi:hypothetical protein